MVSDDFMAARKKEIPPTTIKNGSNFLKVSRGCDFFCCYQFSLGLSILFQQVCPINIMSSV